MNALVNGSVNGSFLAATLDPNKVSPGLLGFIIVVLIGIVVWFLARSMAKQLRKLDADRLDDPEQGDADGTAADEAADAKAAPNNTAPKNTASNGAH